MAAARGLAASCEEADRHKAEALAAIEAPLAEIRDALPTSPLDAEGPRELIRRQVGGSEG